METYIARQAILNREGEVVAYEVIYRQDINAFYNQKDESAANALCDFLNYFGSSETSFTKRMFLTLTPTLLSSEVPFVFNKDELVLQIDKNILINPDIKEQIIEFKSRGYQLALIDFEFSKLFLDNIHVFDYLKVDFEKNSPALVQSLVELAKGYDLEICAYNVNNNEAHTLANKLNFDYVQGSNVAEMMRKETKNVEFMKSNLFRLTAVMSKDDPDFNEIAQIISVDVVLTFSLLRLVNSAYFGLKSKVSDIKQALTILGIKQLREWIYLFSISGSGKLEDELIKTSFMRANFCQDFVKIVPGCQLTAGEAYLLGMFSVLDVILQADMTDILKELSIAAHLKEALLGEESQTRDILQLCIDYEMGEWRKVEALVEALEVEEKSVTQLYLSTLENVNKIWKSIAR